jgi:RNA polymerase sigma-70 factor (ECF subfamily)
MASPPEAAAAGLDRDLVARIAAGDERALGELYDRHAAMVYAMAYRVLGERADAEEAAAETFAQVWREAGRFESGRGSVAAWLVTMARTRALDIARASQRRSRITLVAATSDPRAEAGEWADTPEGSAIAGERSRLVRDAIAQLTPVQREAIELAFYGGLSQSEIAERLHTPLGTVKTRLRLGMQKLRETLAPWLEERHA